MRRTTRSRYSTLFQRLLQALRGLLPRKARPRPALPLVLETITVPPADTDPGAAPSPTPAQEGQETAPPEGAPGK